MPRPGMLEGIVHEVAQDEIKRKFICPNITPQYCGQCLGSPWLAICAETDARTPPGKSWSDNSALLVQCARVVAICPTHAPSARILNQARGKSVEMQRLLTVRLLG